jgi:uncharacterized protein
MLRWFIFLAVLFALEYYTFQAFKTVLKSRSLAIGIEVASLLILFFIIFQFLSFDRSQGQTRSFMLTSGLMLLTVIPKLIFVIVLFSEDIMRFFVGLYYALSEGGRVSTHIPSRRKFVSQVALGLAAIPFGSLLYGIFFGKYDFRVIKQQVPFKDLPDAFDGFRILQISDIHSGSFDNRSKIEYAVDLINQQEFDVLVFTGDIVNSHANEMDPWIDVFASIRNPEFGKFSILGNHDYGEYVVWNSSQEKLENFAKVKDLHQKIGFDLLLNENRSITKDGSSIAMIGVEDWGYRFKKAGDLAKASQGIPNERFKVLLTHDPSHWEYQVKHDPNHYHLTLAGHTHGLQFGIEIPGVFKWSPVQYIYKQWAGLYEAAGRFIYVNRGFGFHAYPGRVGIWPEITVIELKKASR